MAADSLFVCIYGEGGTGKTPVALTAPKPMLVLDAENGSKFVQGARIDWDPLREPVPTNDGTWDTCVVLTRDWATFERAMDILASGLHPFVSVVVDTLDEVQKRCRDNIEASAGRMTEQAWGTLLTKMEGKVRELRDLSMHRDNPLLMSVVLSHVDDRGRIVRPLVQGGLQRSLPGFFDVVAYMFVDDDSEHGVAAPGARRLLVQPAGGFVAKDRTANMPNGGLTGMYGATMVGPFDLSEIRTRIYG